MISLEKRTACAQELGQIADTFLKAGSTLTRMMGRLLSEPEKTGRNIGQVRRFIDSDYPWAADQVAPVFEALLGEMDEKWAEKTRAARKQCRQDREDLEHRRAIKDEISDQAGSRRLKSQDEYVEHHQRQQAAYRDFIRREYLSLFDPGERGQAKRRRAPACKTPTASPTSNVVTGPWGHGGAA